MTHLPVLYNEIIHAMQPHREGLYIDCTLGAGGHAWGILQASSPDGQLLGLDVDPQAIDLAKLKLAEFGNRAYLVRASYRTLLQQMVQLGWRHVDGILLDLGLSSMQLDTRVRGFSFQTEAPLDMRFDPQGKVSAADLVNNLEEKELADLLFHYGEERRSRQVARAIMRARPIQTTTQLVQVVSGVTSGGKSGIHPATRTFQALRIAVNSELEALEEVLPQTLEALAPGGRLAIISFHSLEDRMAKQFIHKESMDCICPPRQPICTCGHTATLRELSKRVVRPQDEEIRKNPRSRSARLRIAERI
ncbi:MAG: 16S rRNA (cytosine(1402)-N(4))-methyltransferase [Chloroflexi bacterium RBG_13_50_21]|jgi:16S rRNA (cytosine1402-N4)-methyltransferase|nr:MAG: 16S rRNA (cytosine(1402)-N(4))-methyltransferase [Chloroflexi bacterium RBG_13_50_21]